MFGSGYWACLSSMKCLELPNPAHDSSGGHSGFKNSPSLLNTERESTTLYWMPSPELLQNPSIQPYLCVLPSHLPLQNHQKSFLSQLRPCGRHNRKIQNVRFYIKKYAETGQVINSNPSYIILDDLLYRIVTLPYKTIYQLYIPPSFPLTVTGLLPPRSPLWTSWQAQNLPKTTTSCLLAKAELGCQRTCKKLLHLSTV